MELIRSNGQCSITRLTGLVGDCGAQVVHEGTIGPVGSVQGIAVGSAAGQLGRVALNEISIVPEAAEQQARLKQCSNACTGHARPSAVDASQLHAVLLLSSKPAGRQTRARLTQYSVCTVTVPSQRQGISTHNTGRAAPPANGREGLLLCCCVAKCSVQVDLRNAQLPLLK